MPKIRLTFDDTRTLNDILFYFRYNNFLNPYKSNCSEKYVILCVKFQINMMIKYIQIFFELTFIIELLEYYEDFCLKKNGISLIFYTKN